MSLTTKAKLVEAATGVPAPAPQNPLESPKGRALTNRLTPRKTFGDFVQTVGIAEPASPTQGLSPEGKYGGFYTASDLETAITGEAVLANQATAQWAADLDRLARSRATEARKAQQQEWEAAGYQSFAPQAGPMSPQAMQNQEAARLRNLYQGMSQAQQVSSQFAPFYSELGQARKEAEAIEDIPITQYARAIATRKYGMNPNLAAGVFGTEFEAEQTQNLRDQQYLDLYGVTEADFRAAQEREYQAGQRALAAEKRLVDQALATRDPELLANEYLQSQSAEVRDLFYLDTLSNVLGANAKGIITASGLTPQQAYSASTRGIDVAETGERITLESELNNIDDLLQARDFEAAIDRVSRLVYTEAEPIARLLSAYVVNLARIAGKPLKEYATLTELMDIGLQNPDGF